MNRLFLILTLALAILVIGSILFVPLFGPKKGAPTPEPVIKSDFSPSPQSRPAPTSRQTLRLISVTPTEDTNQTYFPIKQIFFTFSEPMNPTTFVSEASPKVKMVITLKPDDPNTVVVSPEEKWQPGITTIAILATTTSAAGSYLEKPITYKINTQFPENPPPDSPGL